MLSGGGARGAYEAGALRFVLHDLPRRAGQPVAARFVCGTSAGALNGTYVAAHTGNPNGVLGLSRLWQRLTIEQVYRFETMDMLRSPLRLLRGRVGDELSLVNASPLHALIRDQMPWDALDASLNSGRLEALVLAATEVASGRCCHFIDRRVPGPEVLLPEPDEIMVPTRMSAEHCLASAAIPFLFPPVTVGEQAMVDGGLRQNTPLTPALRLGADRVLVVGVKRPLSERPGPVRAIAPDQLSLTFLLGKALNALMLDPIERDLGRVERMNALLEWAIEEFGAEFADRLANRPAGKGAPYHVVRTLFLRPTEDLGQHAAAAWASGKVQCNRPTRMLLSGIASEEAEDEADLLSYLLFDRTYTGDLEALGYEDARRREEEIARFFDLGNVTSRGL